MSKTYYSFLAVSGDLALLSSERFSPNDFEKRLNDDYALAPGWEAAGIVAVLETIDDRNETRLHVPRDLAYDHKEEIRDSVLERLDIPAGTCPFVEQPSRSSSAEAYTFSRNTDAEWEPAEAPLFRSVSASEDLTERVARRFVSYCVGTGDCEEYDGYHEDYSEYEVQQYRLKGDEWGGDAG